MTPVFFSNFQNGQKPITRTPKGFIYRGVSKNRGFPPKWMVYFMEKPIKMDDLGGNHPYFWVDIYIYILYTHIYDL